MILLTLPNIIFQFNLNILPKGDGAMHRAHIKITKDHIQKWLTISWQFCPVCKVMLPDWSDCRFEANNNFSDISGSSRTTFTVKLNNNLDITSARLIHSGTGNLKHGYTCSPQQSLAKMDLGAYPRGSGCVFNSAVLCGRLSWSNFISVRSRCLYRRHL